jgi:hypothetical protein
MAEKRTRLTETREDVFKDQIEDNEEGLSLSDPGFSYQQINRSVETAEDRFGGLMTEEDAALSSDSLLDEEPKRSSQELFETTTDDLYSARRFHEERSEQAQARDEATDAERVVTDFEKWSESPSRLDFPGVDTTEDVGPTF